MNTAELDIKKARLARRILNEDNVSLIDSLDRNYSKLQKEAKDTIDRKKLTAEFMKAIESMSITVPNYTFNRE
jgi:hypothetical protein